MTHKLYQEETYWNAGLWYYKLRSLPLKALKDEYSERELKIIKLLEAYARLKWQYPGLIQWDYEDFKRILRKYKLHKNIKLYRGRYGLPVLIPKSNFFYHAFAAYPNLNIVYGDKNAGKTIFAWVTAYNIYKLAKDRYDDYEIYVYGDIDGLTKEIKRTCPDTKFAKTLIFMEDYEAPEAEKKVGKFIIYNELDQTVMTGSTFSKEKTELKKMIFRSRHYNYWMFYNVIRHKELFKTIRVSSSFQSIKPMSQKLLEEVVENAVPAPYKNIILNIMSELPYTDAFALIPLYRSDLYGMKKTGSKTFFSITPIDPPAWLLKASKNADEIYEVGSATMQKKEDELIKKAAEMYMEGKSINYLSLFMKTQYGFERGVSWWHKKLTEYFIKKGYEFSKLSEVRKNVETRRLLEEVYG